jgi:hypothetical protein
MRTLAPRREREPNLFMILDRRDLTLRGGLVRRAFDECLVGAGEGGSESIIKGGGFSSGLFLRRTCPRLPTRARPCAGDRKQGLRSDALPMAAAAYT